MKSKRLKRNGIRYTDKQKETYYYQIIYLFHTLEDKRQNNIAEVLGLYMNLTSTLLTEYTLSNESLGELARESKSMDSFVSICIKHKNLNK